MKKFILFWIFATTLAAGIEHAFAEFSITPSIRLREEYNDNILLTEEDEEDDFITTITPSIGLRYIPNSRLDLSLDYWLNFRYYSDHKDFNETDIKDSQVIDFKARAKPFKYFFINIDDIYRKIPADVRRPIAIENIQVNRSDYNIFRISPYIEYPVSSTLAARLGYYYINVWYSAEGGNDSESHSAFVSLMKKLTLKTSASIDYYYLKYLPSVTNEYDSHRGSINITHEIARNLSIWGLVGRDYLKFKDLGSDKLTYWGAGSEYKANVLGGTSIAASYNKSYTHTQAPIKQALSFGYETLLTPENLSWGSSLFSGLDRNSIYSGVSKRELYDLYFSIMKPATLTLHHYYVIDKEVETDRQDKILGAGASISKPLSAKIILFADGLWERQRFLPQGEKVYGYSGSGGFAYRANPILMTRIGYRYNKRISHSNISEDTSEGNFVNNIIWLTANLTF